MSDLARIRQRLTEARAHAANVANCCDEAEEAIRSRNEAKLRVYCSMLYDQAGHLLVEARRAAQLVDRLPLDGLLEDSIAAVKEGFGPRPDWVEKDGLTWD
jgi:hypothetical protein